jgi:hydroxymethylbilane synthase
MPAATAKTLTIGSRGSQLALWQARFIAGQLAEGGVESRIEIIKTTGDYLQSASLALAGGKGLFTKEIEEALLNGQIDLAVHSLKDLPTESPHRLCIAAVPMRATPFDAIVGARLADLALGARVGTSSPRRAAQLRLLRSDLRIDAIRGNVDTRLRKLRDGEFDAILLAAAGLERLGLAGEIAEVFTPDRLCPAPGQGALGVQTRDDDEAQMICGRLNHEPSSQAVQAERSVLAGLGSGCQLPVGAYARVDGDALTLSAVVVAPDRPASVASYATGPARDAEDLGRKVAADLLAQGAGGLLAAGQ